MKWYMVQILQWTNSTDLSSVITFKVLLYSTISTSTSNINFESLYFLSS